MSLGWIHESKVAPVHGRRCALGLHTLFLFLLLSLCAWEQDRVLHLSFAQPLSLFSLLISESTTCHIRCLFLLPSPSLLPHSSSCPTSDPICGLMLNLWASSSYSSTLLSLNSPLRSSLIQLSGGGPPPPPLSVQLCVSLTVCACRACRMIMYCKMCPNDCIFLGKANSCVWEICGRGLKISICMPCFGFIRSPSLCARSWDCSVYVFSHQCFINRQNVAFLFLWHQRCVFEETLWNMKCAVQQIMFMQGDCDACSFIHGQKFWGFFCFTNGKKKIWSKEITVLARI